MKNKKIATFFYTFTTKIRFIKNKKQLNIYLIVFYILYEIKTFSTIPSKKPIMKENILFIRPSIFNAISIINTFFPTF